MHYLWSLHVVLAIIFHGLLLGCEAGISNALDVTRAHGAKPGDLVTAKLQHLLVCHKYSENGQRRTQCSPPTREAKLKRALSELSKVARKWTFRSYLLQPTK